MPVTRRDALLSAGALAAASVIPPAPAMAQEPVPLAQQTSAVALEPICLADFEPLAKAKMPTMGWEYINAGRTNIAGIDRSVIWS